MKDVQQMERKYVLVICPISYDNYDLAGNCFKEEKEFIQSQNYSKDGDLSNGLYGILWGKTPHYPYNHTLLGKWVVIKIEVDSNLICLNRLTNEVKFKRGIVLHIGKISSCAKFILSSKNDKEQFFAPEIENLKESDIIGSDAWIEKTQNNTLVRF